MRGAAKKRLGRCDEAIADLDEALQLEPSDAFALRARGEAKRNLGRCDEAIADLDKALQLKPSDAFALRARGAAKWILGRCDEAVADVNKALRIRPNCRLVLALKEDIAKSPEGAWWQERHKNLCRMSEGHIPVVDSAFDIIGGGPVGLCLAMSRGKGDDQ